MRSSLVLLKRAFVSSLFATFLAIEVPRAEAVAVYQAPCDAIEVKSAQAAEKLSACLKDATKNNPSNSDPKKDGKVCQVENQENFSTLKELEKCRNRTRLLKDE